MYASIWFLGGFFALIRGIECGSYANSLPSYQIL